MSTGFLNPRHIFGLKGDVKDNAWFVEENVVLYPAGHNTILYHTETKTQKFIQGSEGTKGITALAVCPSKRYVAVAERGQRGSVSIYDLNTMKKRKVLTTSECNSAEYISLSFSNNKTLLTLGGAPDWTLVLWNWEKAKALSSVKVSNANGAALSKCSFNPSDPSVVCVTGDGIFKAFRIVENVFKPMPNLLGQMEPRSFTSHLWLNDDRVLLGTDDGVLVLFEAGEFLAVLESSPNDDKAITCMASLSDGFIIGCQGGMLRVYTTVDDEHGYYRETKSMSVADACNKNGGNAIMPILHSSPSKSGGDLTGEGSSGNNGGSAGSMETIDDSIWAIAISPSEENALVSLRTNQLVMVTFNSTDLIKQDEMSSKLLADSFHRHGMDGTAKITGLDVCVRKPLVVTCGLDRSVRVWNYLDNRCELVKFFSEEAHSVSFHPSGLHLLVGFSDKLRFMNLLMDDLRTAKELPIKACREVQFSNGGHLFAAVNGNTIQVFNTYSCECVRTMRGHNGKVRSLFWSANDSQIVSSGMDGAVYQWDLKENKRDGEYVKKGCNYSCALSNKTGDAVFAVGSDRMLREVEFPVSVVTKEIECNAIVGQLAISASQRMLFGGTADTERPGSVRSFKFPLTGDFTEHVALSAPITKMKLSWEDQFLFVAGEDGVLEIFEVREKDGRAGVSGGANGTGQATSAMEAGAGTATSAQVLQYSEEILVTKSDLEEKNALMLELKSKVDELTLHNEYQLRLKDMNYNEKIKEVTEKFTQELEQDKNRYELLREEKNDLEMEYAEKIKQVEEKHQQRLQEIESAYQTKIMAEVERYQQLCHERDQQKTQWDKQQQMLIESHEQYISEITLDYQQQLQEDVELKGQLVGEVEDLKREFGETMRQLEGDIDKEIELLKSKYEGKLNAEREATLRFKGENGIMKKKFSALQKDIEVQREEIKAILEKEQDLVAQIRILEKEIQNLRSEIRDRDETIGDKEKRIYDLKKKNQELEKFKFVLDYKIKELKRQIEPRENEIGDMREQIKEMDHELEQYHKSNASLDVMIGELRTKLDTMQKVIMSNRQKLSDQKVKMSRFVAALDETAQYVQNQEKLREKVKEIYEANVNEQVKVETIDVDIKREYNRQKGFLEKSAESLKKKLETDVQKHKEENMEIMERNMNLIKEINGLREEIRVAKLKSITDQSDIVATKPSTTKGNNNGGNKSSRKSKLIPGSPTKAIQAAAAAPPMPTNNKMTPEESQLLEQQRNEIGRLKAYLHDLEEKMGATRPGSRERLAPIE